MYTPLRTCICMSCVNDMLVPLTLNPFIHVQSWPDDALTIVAQRFLDDVEMEDSIKDSCVEMCKEFHQTTRKLSDRYLTTLQRHNYVTPTSYLELISTYKTLLSMKRRYVYVITPHVHVNQAGLFSYVYFKLCVLSPAVKYRSCVAGTRSVWRNFNQPVTRWPECRRSSRTSNPNWRSPVNRYNISVCAMYVHSMSVYML